MQTTNLTSTQYHNWNYWISPVLPLVPILCCRIPHHMQWSGLLGLLQSITFFFLTFHRLNASKEHSSQALCRISFNLCFLMFSPNYTRVMGFGGRIRQSERHSECIISGIWPTQPTMNGLGCIFIILSLVYFIHVFLQFSPKS